MNNTKTIKLVSIFLLFLNTTSNAQTTATWDWANCTFSADGSDPTAYCNNATICLDTSGTIVITGGVFVGIDLSYNDVVYGGGALSHPVGDIFEFDSSGVSGTSGPVIIPNSDSDVNVTRVINDGNNNLYITGTFRGQYFHPPSPLLYNTHFYNTDIFIEKINLSNSIDVLWATSAGGVNDDYVSDVCIDKNFNAYITGNYSSGFMAFGTDTIRHSSGNNEFYIAKYNSTGNIVWAIGATNMTLTEGTKITTDNNGFLYVTGMFNDTFTFEGSTIVSALGGATLSTFLAKIDTNGNLVWLKGYDGNSARSSVVCNSSNEVYLTGNFNGTSIALDTFTLNNASTIGDAEIFLAKIDSGGHVKWAQGFGGTIGGEVYGVAVDKYNNGYITGSNSSASMVCGPDTIYNSYPYQPEGFVIKFDSSGHVIYAKSASANNSSGEVMPTAITSNKRGDVYITGNIENAETILFGSISSPVLIPVPPYNICFLAKIDSVPNCTCSVTSTSSTTFCSGDSVILNATNTTGNTYQWYLGSSSIPGASNYDYTAHSAGVYSVYVTNLYGCNSSANVSVSVNPLPVAGTISGLSTVCDGSAITLTDATTGGAWSSSNAAVGTVGTGGIVAGVAAGTDTIKYSVTNVCGTAIATYEVTVDPLSALTSSLTPPAICDSTVFTYEPFATIAGTTLAWTRAVVAGISNPAGSGTGTINETLVNTTLAPVAATYVYTLTANGCENVQDVTVTVNFVPSAGAITGASSVCIGSSITLSDAVTGGTWDASNDNALVSGSGVIHGFSVGVDTITYTVTFSSTCNPTVAVTATVTVNPLPNAGTITGEDSVCISDTISLADAATGGVWSADNGNAFVTGSGVVLGVTAGTDVITYSITNACGTANATTLIDVKVCNTGIRNMQAPEANITLYPNPAQNTITITSSGIINSIVINDLVGRQVFSGTYNTNEATINLAQLPGGMYMAKINGYEVRKFVKE